MTSSMLKFGSMKIPHHPAGNFSSLCFNFTVLGCDIIDILLWGHCYSRQSHQGYSENCSGRFAKTEFLEDLSLLYGRGDGICEFHKIHIYKISFLFEETQSFLRCELPKKQQLPVHTNLCSSCSKRHASSFTPKLAFGSRSPSGDILTPCRRSWKRTLPYFVPPPPLIPCH